MDKGRNTFNIGVEFRRSYQDDNEEQTEGGHFNFSQRTTSIPNPNDPNFGNYGSSFASFLLGLPDSANRSNSQELRLRNCAISPYIQDDIKLSPKLTVNVGLRWDIQVPFTENNNLIVFFNPDNPGTNPAPAAFRERPPSLATAPVAQATPAADIHYGHIGPRFGFAYKLSEKTVVQGGFDVAFLNGGAYEYGTNKVAVNYGNLLTGSFTRNSTGSNHIVLRKLGYQPDPCRQSQHSVQSGPRSGNADQRIQQERRLRSLQPAVERQHAARAALQHVHHRGMGRQPHHSPAQPAESDQPAGSQRTLSLGIDRFADTFSSG